MAVVDGKMNSQAYRDVCQENLRPSLHQLKLNRGWVMQQDNNPKHRSKSSREWFQQTVIRLMECSSQSPDPRSCGMTSREWFTPDILTVLLNCNDFVQRNGPKFFLTVWQVWSATTGNDWLRFADCVCLVMWLRCTLGHIFRPIYKEIQIIPNGSHSFSCNCS